MINLKIIQSSPKQTGSTLLLNLLMGFLCPDEEIHWDTETLINKYLVTKTHNTNIDELEKKYPNYKLFFIMSERYDEKIKKLINNKYRDKQNVLIIDYSKILETNNYTLVDIVDYIFIEFIKFIPEEVMLIKDSNLIKKNMIERINKVNETVLLMKNEPFSKWDKFTGIHGGHRNR